MGTTTSIILIVYFILSEPYASIIYSNQPSIKKRIQNNPSYFLLLMALWLPILIAIGVRKFYKFIKEPRTEDWPEQFKFNECDESQSDHDGRKI